MRPGLIATALLIGLVAHPCAGQQAARSFLPVGVFIAPIEEGARIFTPVRLLPFDHPEAFEHEFPNVQQLRGCEFETLVLLGTHAGLGLGVTLQRYPQQPDTTWPYENFDQPPIDALRRALVVERPRQEVPLPGLRVAAFHGGQLVGFIVDTRGLSLAARGMQRPTAMGLDINRAAFLEAARKASIGLPKRTEATIVVFGEK